MSEENPFWYRNGKKPTNVSVLPLLLRLSGTTVYRSCFGDDVYILHGRFGNAVSGVKDGSDLCEWDLVNSSGFAPFGDAYHYGWPDRNAVDLFAVTSDAHTPAIKKSIKEARETKDRWTCRGFADVKIYRFTGVVVE